MSCRTLFQRRGAIAGIGAVLLMTCFAAPAFAEETAATPTPVATALPTVAVTPDKPAPKPTSKQSLSQVDKPNVDVTTPAEPQRPTPAESTPPEADGDAAMTSSRIEVKSVEPSADPSASAKSVDTELTRTVSRAPEGPPPVPKPLPTYNVEWVDAARQSASLEGAHLGAAALMDVRFIALRGADPLIWVIGGAGMAILGLMAVLALAADKRG